MKTTGITGTNINALFEKIASVIEEARRRASTAIDLSEVYAKFSVGRYIVEDEQGGKKRAAYGKQVLEQLSRKIEERFGEGWSVDTLKRCRKFYSIYSSNWGNSAAPIGTCSRLSEFGQRCCPNSREVSRTPQIGTAGETAAVDSRI